MPQGFTFVSGRYGTSLLTFVPWHVLLRRISVLLRLLTAPSISSSHLPLRRALFNYQSFTTSARDYCYQNTDFRHQSWIQLLVALLETVKYIHVNFQASSHLNDHVFKIHLKAILRHQRRIHPLLDRRLRQLRLSQSRNRRHQYRQLQIHCLLKKHTLW